MFNFISDIVNGVKKLYYNTKEKLYGVLNFFGANIKPSHFSSEDLKHYKEWIEKHQKLLKKITNSENLPDFLTLSSNGAIAITKGDYKPKKGKYIHKLEHNNKLLRDNIAHIVTYINEYNFREENSKGFLARRIGAEANKLTPQKMIIRMLQEHLKLNVLYYTDKQRELDQLDDLITYLYLLTSNASVKKDHKFHGLLLVIVKNLVDARDKLEARVRFAATKDRLQALINSAGNFASSILVFIFNLFCFNKITTDTEIYNYSSNLALIGNSKLKSWFASLDLYREKDLDFTMLSPEDYQREISIITAKQFSVENNTANDKVDMAPPLVKLFHSDSSSKHLEWQKLIDIQTGAMDFITAYKVLSSLEQKLSIFSGDDSRLGLIRLKKILDAVSLRATELLQPLALATASKRFFDDFRSDRQTQTKDVDKAAALELRAKNLSSVANGILEQVSKCIDDVSPCLLSVDSSVANDDSLCDIISMLDKRYSLIGKSKTVVDDRVKQFLLTLRQGGRFPDRVKQALSQFFVIIDADNNLGLTGINEDTVAAVIDEVDFGTGAGFVYYTILLKVLITLVKPNESEADISLQVTKLKNFLVDNFLLHDERSIKHLLDALIGHIITGYKLEQENNDLRYLIEEHIKLFEKNIHEYVDYACNLLQASHESNDISLSAKLKNFITAVAKELSEQQKLADKMILDFSQMPMIDDSEESPSSQIFLANLARSITSSEKISNVLLRTIELTTSLISAHSSFRNNYKLIVGGEANLPEFDIDEISILQSQIKNLAQHSSICTEQLTGIQERFEASVYNQDTGLDSNIKSQLKEYIDTMLETCQIKLRSMVLQGYSNGADLVFEIAAIKYIYEILSTHDDLNESDIDGISIVISSFLQPGRALTVDTADLLKKIAPNLPVAKNQGQLPGLTLITKLWDKATLGCDVEDAVINRQAEVESSVKDALASRGMVAL